MNKKLLSVILCAVMLISCIGIVNVSASDYVTDLMVSEETGVTSSAVDGFPELVGAETPNSAWNRSGYYAISGHTSFYIAKFDLTPYAGQTLKKAEFTISYRETSTGNSYVYVVPNNWSAEDFTYNDIPELFGEDYVKYESAVNPSGYDWKAGLLVDESDNPVYKYATPCADVTAYVNEILNDPEADKTISLAVSRHEDGGNLRIRRNKSKLVITRDVPDVSTVGVTKVLDVAQHGKIDPLDPYVAGATETVNNSTAYKLETTKKQVPYGNAETVYLKYDFTDVKADVETATLNVRQVCQSRTWIMAAYLVEDDSWTPSELTWYNVYDTENLSVNASIVHNDVEITGENLPAAKKWAPNPSVYATYAVSGSSKNDYYSFNVDVTNIVKEGLKDDRKVTIAIAIAYNTNNAYEGRYTGFTVNANYPKLNCTFVPTKVSEVGNSFKFKVNGVEASNLSSGFLGGEFEVLSDMYEDSQAAVIMAVYQGDVLSEFISSSVQTINDKNTNDGKTTLTVTSDKEIQTDENTTVKFFIWRGKFIQQPVCTSKTVTVSGIQ